MLSKATLATAALLIAAQAQAEQVFLLTTGYSLVAERHERVGDRIRLHAADGGVTEMPASLVTGIEERESAPVPAAPPEQPQVQAGPPVIENIVAAESATNRLHPELLYSVIAAESNFNPQALSAKGAIGLMQLMPETAAELEVNPHDPAQNVQGGAQYLRFLLNKYAGSKDQLVRAIAAYNAGPAAVDRYNGIPPYAETQNFVSRVLKRFVALAGPAPR
jgi:soluble lytic murein transglycosylase-like protein